MNRFKWFYHPVFIFVFSIIALTASLCLYVYWYIGVSAGLTSVIQRYNLDPNQFFEINTWVVILILSVLVGIILVGVFVIFIYNQKTWQLYRLQRNFINNFTHELKTPVTSLKLYLETFAQHDLSREEQVKYIGYMIHDVERLLSHINRILSLARIESGNYWKEFIEMDLVDTVRQFYQNNADLFRNCEVKIHNPVGKPLYYAINPLLFDMFLMNIMTNAVHYNESDHPRVDVHFVPSKKGVDIRFEDNGVGIEKGEIKKIFRMFYQVGNPDNMTATGGGLGLYLVQQIARIHRGRVWAESGGKGKGSIFSLTLPRRVQVQR